MAFVEDATLRVHNLKNEFACWQLFIKQCLIRSQPSKINPKHVCCSQPIAQEAYINSKIYEANVLIDRVKGTLLDIKNKGNVKVPEEISVFKNTDEVVDPVEVVLVIPQLKYEDIDEVTTTNCEIYRPKTRRPECVHDTENSHEIDNKFKNTPEGRLSNDLIEDEMTSLECLQAKLNTINEQTESDISSALSENKTITDEKEGSIASTSCHTVVLQESEEIQVQPEVTSLGIQNSCSSANNTTQTIAEQKTLTAENTGSNEIILTPAKLGKPRRLIFQILPPVSIDSGYSLQQVHNFFIDSFGITHFHSKISAKNVGYYEMKECDDELKKSKITFDSDPEVISKTYESESPKREESGSSESYSTVEHMFALKEKILDEQRGMENVETQERASNKDIKSEISTCSNRSKRELVYKSFQLYDNPDHHAPVGEFKTPCIEDSVYKTYINPEGLPKKLISEYAGVLESDTLKKITSIAKIISKKTNVIPSPSAPSETRSHVNSLTPEKELNSKLWDIGLYSSKETQCDISPDVVVNEEKQQVLKDTSSYEKVSFTISYSTGETVLSDTSSQNKHKNDFSTGRNEDKLQTVRPTLDRVEKAPRQILPKYEQKSASKTFKDLKDKLSEEHDGINTKRLHLNESYDSDVSSLPTDTTATEFISGLTVSTDQFSKELPRIRKSITKYKAKENHKTNFNVLSVQTHGDCISNDYPLKSPHLELSPNGRYKDEENMFCDNYYPKIENPSLRRKVLRNLSKCNNLKKYNLDSSKSDTVSMEDAVSEGEVKCQCSASMGEIHKCKHIKPSLNKHPVLYNNFNVDSNVTIREHRTYFDNWITYYVNKNKTFLCDSSASSGSK